MWLLYNVITFLSLLTPHIPDSPCPALLHDYHTASS